MTSSRNQVPKSEPVIGAVPDPAQVAAERIYEGFGRRVFKRVELADIIRAAYAEREQAVARLVEACNQFFAVRAETEMTYEGAYQFTFKSGPLLDAWNALNAALRAIEEGK